MPAGWFDLNGDVRDLELVGCALPRAFEQVAHARLRVGHHVRADRIDTRGQLPDVHVMHIPDTIEIR